MSVAHTPAGFAGTVDEVAETRRFGLIGPPFRVATVADWAPTGDPSVNRQVNLSAGQAAAYGVADMTTAPDSLTFAANNGTQNRYDALVATWAWAANASAGLNAHTVTFRVIPGGTTLPQVNGTSTVDNTKINRIKGVQYDALIAAVRVRPGVGLFSSGDVVDCRMWAGYEGYANTGGSQYLTSLDTQPGSLVHDVTTDIVWNRLSSGAWGFEKWIGTDRTKQPMISLRRTAYTVVSSPTSGLIGGWGTVVDHGTQGGATLLSYNSSTWVRCEVPGRVRIEAYGSSDLGDIGTSWVRVDFPAGGGHVLNTLEDQAQRNAGYAMAGALKQPISAGPIQVGPGDLIGVSVAQISNSGGSCNYDVALTVTYV